MNADLALGATVGEAATETIGGTVTAAQDLPDEVAGPLLQQAFEAYTNGFTSAATVGATVLTISGIAAGILLRKVAAPQAAELRE